MPEYEANEFSYQKDHKVIYNESDGVNWQRKNEEKLINYYRKNAHSKK